MKLRFSAFATLIAFAASSASAQTVNVGVVDNSAGGDPLMGFVTNDVTIDTDPGTSIGSLQILLELTAGTIFQQATGGDVPSGSPFFAVFPDLEFDTFVAAGASSNDDFTPLIFGASDSLGGPGGGATFSDSVLDATFSPAAGQPTDGVSGFLASRISLSDDAAGSFLFQADFGGGNIQSLSLDILDGVIGDPIVGGVTTDPAPGEVFTVSFGDPTLDPAVTLAGGPVDAVAFDDPADDEFFNLINNGDSVGVELDVTADFSGFAPGTLLTAPFTITSGTDTFGFSVQAAVPEPATFGLVGLALVGVAGLRRRS